MWVQGMWCWGKSEQASLRESRVQATWVGIGHTIGSWRNGYIRPGLVLRAQSKSMGLPRQSYLELMLILLHRAGESWRLQLLFKRNIFLYAYAFQLFMGVLCS